MSKIVSIISIIFFILGLQSTAYSVQVSEGYQDDMQNMNAQDRSKSKEKLKYGCESGVIGKECDDRLTDNDSFSKKKPTSYLPSKSRSDLKDIYRESNKARQNIESTLR